MTASWLKNGYHQFIQQKTNRIMLPITALIYFGVHIFLTWTISMDILIGLILLIIAIIIHKTSEDLSLLIFIVSLFFILISNPITMVILIVLGMYLVFKWFDHRRINALNNISKKSPVQLSKVSTSNPRVEIIIRGERK